MDRAPLPGESHQAVPCSADTASTEDLQRRSRGAVSVLNLEVVYTPAPASQIAIMEDSLQLLAVWAVRAARAALDSS